MEKTGLKIRADGEVRRLFPGVADDQQHLQAGEHHEQKGVHTAGDDEIKLFQ